MADTTLEESNTGDQSPSQSFILRRAAFGNQYGLRSSLQHESQRAVMVLSSDLTTSKKGCYMLGLQSPDVELIRD